MIETGEINDFCESIAMVSQVEWTRGELPRMHRSLKWGRLSGRVSETTSRGWPIPWTRTFKAEFYEDPINRKGFLPITTDPAIPSMNEHTHAGFPGPVGPRTGWSWEWATIYHCPPPEQTQGRFVTTKFSLLGVLIPVVGSVLVFWVIGVFRAIVFRDSKFSKRSRRWSMIAGLAVFVLLALPSIFVSTTAIRMGPAFDPGKVLPHSKSHFYRHEDAVEFDIAKIDPASPSFDPEFAMQVFEQVVELPPPYVSEGAFVSERPVLPDLEPVLVVATTRESRLESFGNTMHLYSADLPLVAVMDGVYFQHPDYAFEGKTHAVQPNSVRVRWHKLNLNIYWPKPGTDRTIQLTLYFQPIMFSLAAMITIVWLIELPMWLIAWRQRRNRILTTCCVACGYGPLTH